MDAKVSVITVCYNAEKTIEQTIKSVLGQTYTNIEYIIVDGKSTDRTMEIVQKYKGEIAKIISEPDEGIYHAMNKGIAVSSGDIIGIVNSDDWYEKDAVERVVACFHRNKADIVYGDIRFVWGENKIEDAPKTRSLDELWHSMVIRHPATFVKREVYENIGMYDRKYRIAADYDFVMRCYTEGVDFSYLPCILTNFRMTGVSNIQSEQCADEARSIQLKYAEKSEDKQKVYKILYENMDEEIFLKTIENEKETIVGILADKYSNVEDRVVIWGTGVWGKIILQMLKKAKVRVLAFVDNDFSKWGGFIENIPIVSSDYIKHKKVSLVIAIRYLKRDFFDKLKELGIDENDFVTINDLKDEILNVKYKKTILYFFDYGGGFGGAANTLLQQMVLARDAGYRVMAFVSSYDSKGVSKEYQQKFEKYEIEWMKLDFVMCSQPEDIDITGVFRCFEYVLQVVMKYRPVLLHSMQINPVVELVSRELLIPHIMNIYQAIPDFFALQYTDIFPKYHICDSLCFASVWEKGLHIQSKCIRTVVNDFQPKRYLDKKEVINFICVGQITPRKNQLEVIKAFKGALEKGVKGRLWLYGYDQEEYAQRCREYIIEKGLQDNIFVCGFCVDMKEVYRRADVLVCGSMVESYPNVISEAFANGLIIISAPVAGVPEVVHNAENGYLTDGYEAEDFEAKMLECYESFQTGKAQKLLECANTTFENVHAKEIVAEELTSYYEEIIGKGVIEGRPTISSVREKFQEMFTICREYEDEFKDMRFVEAKLWYLYHIKDRLRHAFENNKKIYIWGAGKMGCRVLQMLNIFCPDMVIKGFVDSRARGYCEGYHIVEPMQVMEDVNSVIIVAILHGQQEVLNELNRADKVYGEDYYLMVPRFW